MSKRVKKLEDLLAKARELSALDETTPEQDAELTDVMTRSKAVQAQIANDRQINEFERTVADEAGEVLPTEKAIPDAYMARVGGFGVFAERKGFDGAVKEWKSKSGKEWGFDLRYKVIDAGVTALTNVPALDQAQGGADDNNQHAGVVAPYFYPGIIEPPTRVPMIADLFAQGSTDSNVVRLVKETVTNGDTAGGGDQTYSGAAPTAEGVSYTVAKIEVSAVDWPVRDITTILPVSEDILSDVPAMSAYLGSRLAKFVQLAEEKELVAGDGTGSHLTGLMHLVGRTVSTQGARDIDTAVMRLLARVYKNSFMDPTWVAMSPTTWAEYVTLRTDLNGGLGQFLVGPGAVTQAPIRSIWGLPITVTPVIPDDSILVGNPQAGMVFRNGGLRVESSTGYGTYFGEGLVAIRGKVRTAFACFRPQAIGELLIGS